jgi:acetyl-CoA C-acetyltransferase
MSDPIVIAGAARTPMGGFQGALSGASAAQLGGAAIAAALARAGLEPAAVEELLMGCVLPAGQGQAPARQAGFTQACRRRCRRPRSTRCAARA